MSGCREPSGWSEMESCSERYLKTSLRFRRITIFSWTTTIFSFQQNQANRERKKKTANQRNILFLQKEAKLRSRTAVSLCYLAIWREVFLSCPRFQNRFGFLVVASQRVFPALRDPFASFDHLLHHSIDFETSIAFQFKAISSFLLLEADSILFAPWKAFVTFLVNDEQKGQLASFP